MATSTGPRGGGTGTDMVVTSEVVDDRRQAPVGVIATSYPSTGTRGTEYVATNEPTDDRRPVGFTWPYACSGEVDHCQHFLLCLCSVCLWTPCWAVACCLPGFCPVPCGDNCSCESKNYVDPLKRLMWKLGKVNQVFTVEISPRPQLVSGIINPSPEILRAPVSGAPCVIYDVIAWEYVDAGSAGAVDCDEEGVEKGEGFDNEGLEDKANKQALAEGGAGAGTGIVGFRNKIWVKRFEETRTADFYLSDPNYSSATHPDGPKMFVPARGPQGGSDGHLLAMDFHPLRKNSTRRGMLTIYFSGTELVIPHNITELGARHGFVHSRSRRRVMRYEERAYCVGDPVALMGVVGKGTDPFAKPMPVMTPMLKQELPLAYYQLLKMSEQERSTLIGVQGKILITGDMNSLEPPFIGCACFSEWEPCGGCTSQGCSKMC